tara:strand:+ start:88 stop:636 length:549 start_codon:yes stop_codon:yes gene_type:complete
MPSWKKLIQSGSDAHLNTLSASSAHFDGSVRTVGSITPDSTTTYDLGSKGKKWRQVFAQDTFFGGVHELNLETPELGKLPDGTILVWRNGTLVPCDSEADYMIMGVVKRPADSPVILGAEDILVTGKVDEGDFIITSDKIGHGMGVKQNWLFKKDLFGKVIAQALESCDGESNLIRAMIRKM